MDTRLLLPMSTMLMILLAGCSLAPQKTDSFVVAATFFPLYDLTKSIVGEGGEVYPIVPSGIEPHDYEPNPSDLETLNSADAFVTMGIEFAEFEEDLVAAVNPSIAVISAGNGIPLLEASQDEHDGQELGEDEHRHGGEDPHIWLSPKNAQLMVSNIAAGLKKADPPSAALYQRNSEELMSELRALDAEFTQGLISCNKDVILVNHNAFSYLARDYGFRIIAVSGLEPEAEPTPKQLSTLVDQAKENDLHYIFYEEMVDPRIASTIAQEVGAEILGLSSLEGASSASDTYISLMKENLKNLEAALECQ